MSWNNIIPSSVVTDILDKIDQEPKQQHFDSDIFYTCFTIKEEYITTCNEAFTWINSTGGGENGTISKRVDHPAFAALRKHLHTRGFIHMESGWCNGDRVLKPFYLNKVFFEVGDKFLSADAMSLKLNFKGSV